jgi:hypothetical protein
MDALSRLAQQRQSSLSDIRGPVPTDRFSSMSNTNKQRVNCYLSAQVGQYSSGDKAARVGVVVSIGMCSTAHGEVHQLVVGGMVVHHIDTTAIVIELPQRGAILLRHLRTLQVLLSGTFASKLLQELLILGVDSKGFDRSLQRRVRLHQVHIHKGLRLIQDLVGLGDRAGRCDGGEEASHLPEGFSNLGWMQWKCTTKPTHNTHTHTKRATFRCYPLYGDNVFSAAQ